MAGGWGERIVWLLDRCWPFPLGIAACTLVLAVSTGIWWAIRDPLPATVSRPLGQTGSVAGEASPGAIPVATEPGGRPATAEQIEALAPPSASQESSPPTKVATPTATPKPPVEKAKAQPRPVSRQLSAAQRAAIADRLTIGRFLVDRKDYSAAIKEFQAALAIDPTNREAQTAIQRARAADAN